MMFPSEYVLKQVNEFFKLPENDEIKEIKMKFITDEIDVYEFEGLVTSYMISREKD